MAADLEIVVVAEIADNQKDTISALDEELTGREKDSGHWSVEYTIGDKENTDEESVNTRSPSNETSTISEEEEDNGNGDDLGKYKIPDAPPPPPLRGMKQEFAIIMADDDGADAGEVLSKSSIIRLPVPLPSLKNELHLYDSDDSDLEEDDDILTDGTSVRIHEPVVKRTEDDKCCIVCYEPNEVTEYDEFDYNLYMDVHHVLNSHLNLPCCQRLVCKECLNAIISTIVGEGRVQISCPHPECGKPFTKEYVLNNVTNREVKQKYLQFLVDVENDGKRKTCPNCCHITEYELPRRLRLKESDLKITCDVCQHDWCFRCHAPWHKDISCREFQKGNKEFRKWTKSKQRGIPNCQKCPTCRVYIQRSTGCHHMQCNRCDTDFCYDCGGRFLELGIIDHESTLNVWGCPDNYHKDEPFIRNSVRWGYLTAKLSYLIAYPPLLFGACGLLVVGAVIVLPVYAGFKLHSYAKFRRRNNRRRRN